MMSRFGWIALLLFGGSLTADERPVHHVIIAADHSSSMHDSGHIMLQTQAIVAALENYVEACEQVEVIYQPWGNFKNHITYLFELTSHDARHHFREKLVRDLVLLDLGITNHGPAFRQALGELEKRNAIDALMLFITDEDGSPVNVEVPPGIVLYKVSLGGPSVAEYLRTEMVPGYGYHFHANTIEELQLIIHDVFSMAAMPCLG